MHERYVTPKNDWAPDVLTYLLSVFKAFYGNIAVRSVNKKR